MSGAFHATNDPGTCLWCGKNLAKDQHGDGLGYGSNGFFCTLGCGYRFGRAAASGGYRFEPKSEPPPKRKRTPPEKTPKCAACKTRMKLHFPVADDAVFLFCPNVECRYSHEWFPTERRDGRWVFTKDQPEAEGKVS